MLGIVVGVLAGLQEYVTGGGGTVISCGGGGVVDGVGLMDVKGERRVVMSSSICFIMRLSAASWCSFCCFAICIICLCSSSISSTSSSSSGCVGWACAGVGALPFGGMLNFVN